MIKSNVTIEQLARIVQKGFQETVKKTEMGLGFKKVNNRIDKVEKRLNRIENILLEKHSEEIRYLKERGGKLEEALAME